MRIKGSEELFDRTTSLPVEPLRLNRLLGDAQHAAMQTARKLGQVIVLVYDDDESAYNIEALDIDAPDQ